MQKISGGGGSGGSGTSSTGTTITPKIPPVGGATGGSTTGISQATKLLLPPVVQPTVTNPTGAGRLPGKPLGLQKLSQPKRSPVAAVSPTKKPAVPPARKQPVAVKPAPAQKKPLASSAKLQKQLSADRGPPAAGYARCPHCARDFAADRLSKHESVCQRTRARRTKVFDASKKRLEAVAAEAGVDIASFKKKVGGKTHEALRRVKHEIEIFFEFYAKSFYLYIHRKVMALVNKRIFNLLMQTNIITFL